MSELLEIQEFIENIVESLSHVLEMEVLVMDDQCQMVACQLKHIPVKNATNHTTIVAKVIESGRPHITDNPKDNEDCRNCVNKADCQEKGFMHYPININEKVLGVFGLICFTDAQLEQMIKKQNHILIVLQSITKLIALQLQEKKTLEKLALHNVAMNQAINAISDGYILTDSQKQITNINGFALKILGLTSKSEAVGKCVFDILKSPELRNLVGAETGNFYDEIEIDGKLYGVIITPIRNDNELLGFSINFKTVHKIGSRVYGKAFDSKEIRFSHILGESSSLLRAKELAYTISKSNPNVMLLGDSGTGKELFARSIHYESDRSQYPFIPINCAAIPVDLLESELFGYEKGAFTGAAKSGKIGKFEMANKGTLFLDEIGDMPIHLQSKILRVVQDRQVDKIGGNELKDINIRIISATNKNIETMVEEGTFREDLYYRLNVIPIHIPPLSKRISDIPVLAEFFIEKYTRTFEISKKKMDEAVLNRLVQYHWPGNVRELENVCQYLVAMSINFPGNLITENQLPEKLFMEGEKNSNSREEVVSAPLADKEKQSIRSALNEYGYTTEGKLKAAESLGISIATLYRKIKKYQLTKPFHNQKK